MIEYKRPGIGWIGAIIMLIVAILELVGIPVPKAEWWEVLGFAITLAL